MSTPNLSIRQLTVTFQNGNGGLEALGGVSFDVRPQEFICILGPSGSGKSTLLRAIAGLIEPTSGEIQFTGAIDGARPRIGYVFQQANLMPWRTVISNIMLPLELENVEHATAERQARELIELVGLNGFENAWPGDLSGGMAQRVAIARALIHDPEYLLLDEPFGALDALTRERMGAELLRIWQARQKTVLMVTHSISEALYLADRVLVLTSRPGVIQSEMQVPLPRPRADDMRYTDRFAEMSRELRKAIEADRVAEA
jgi:NitT/TauT family transport system ATP-binding protein